MEFQWRNQPGGYLREILTAKVYNIAVRHERQLVERLRRSYLWGCPNMLGGYHYETKTGQAR